MPSTTPATDSKGRASAGLLALVCALLFASVRAAHQTPDSLGYALAAVTGSELFHPHHLLFSPLVRVFWLALAPFGADGVLAGQVHNLVWAAVAVATTHLAVREFSGSWALGLGAALLLLSFHGFGFQTSQVETYVPATGCAALLLFELVRSHTRAVPLRRGLLAFAIGGAVLYHQSNVLLAVPLLALAAITRDEARRRGVVTALVIAGVSCLAIYVAAYASTVEEASVWGFVDFCLRYAISPRPQWGSVAHYSSNGVAAVAEQQLWNVVLLAESLRPTGSVVLAIGGCALAAWNSFRLWRPGAASEGLPDGDGVRELRVFVLCWTMAHFVFFLWWLPGEREFFTLSLLFPIWLSVLALVDLRPARRQAAGFAFVAAACVLLPFHVMRSMIPMSATRGPAYAAAERLLEAAPAGCTLLTSNAGVRALRYYFGRSAEEVYSARRWKLQLLAEERPRGLPDLSERHCVAIPWRELNPERAAVAGHPELSGRANPEGFARFLRWALRADGGLPTGRVEAPPVSGLTIGRGERFVLSGDPRQATSEEAVNLLRRIDGLVTGGAAGPLSQWASAQRAALRGAAR